MLTMVFKAWELMKTEREDIKQEEIDKGSDEGWLPSEMPTMPAST